MKVVEHKKKPKSQYGNEVISNYSLMPHERATLDCLSSFGFDVETIVPSHTPKTHNPDLLMLGTVWEMKGPIGANEKTIRKRFRKAIKQANGRAIFDLRNIGDRRERHLAKEIVMTIFKNSREMRRIMIIENDESILDIIK